MAPNRAYDESRNHHTSKGLIVVSTSRPLRIVAALLIAALALAGCSARPGTAAVVDGRSISESELSDAVEDLTALLGAPAGTTPVLERLIKEPVAVEVGSEIGISVTDDQVHDFLDGIAEQEGRQPPASYSSGATTVGRFIMITSAAPQDETGAQLLQEIETRSAELDVELNPRYGTWADGAPMAQTPEWIQRAEADPVASTP